MATRQHASGAARCVLVGKVGGQWWRGHAGTGGREGRQQSAVLKAHAVLRWWDKGVKAVSFIAKIKYAR